MRWLTKFAFEGGLPSIGAVGDFPNAETLAAFDDADGDEGKTFMTPKALFEHLGI